MNCRNVESSYRGTNELVFLSGTTSGAHVHEHRGAPSWRSGVGSAVMSWTSWLPEERGSYLTWYGGSEETTVAPPSRVERRRGRRRPPVTEELQVCCVLAHPSS